MRGNFRKFRDKPAGKAKCPSGCPRCGDTFDMESGLARCMSCQYTPETQGNLGHYSNMLDGGYRAPTLNPEPQLWRQSDPKRRYPLNFGD